MTDQVIDALDDLRSDFKAHFDVPRYVLDSVPHSPPQALGMLAKYVSRKALDVGCRDMGVLAVRATRNNVSTVFALVFADSEARYVSCGYSYLSMDGEYKPNFYGYPWIMGMIRDHKSIGMFVNQVKREISRGVISIDVEVQSGLEFKVDRHLVSSFSDSDDPLMLFVYCQYMYSAESLNNRLPAHINPKYTTAMGLSGSFPDAHSIVQGKMLWVRYGAKLRPLTVTEAKQRGNINYAVWVESYVLDILGEMYDGLVSPAATYKAGEFIVRTSPGLFDNPSMEAKIARSDEMGRITDKINDVRRDLHRHQEMTLMNDIVDPIRHAESKIVLSAYSLVLVYKYQGLTMDTILSNPDTHVDSIGSPLTKLSDMRAMIFQLVYCLAANNEYGIVQGDLHLNNLCVDFVYPVYKAGKLTYNVDRPPHVYFEAFDYKWILPWRGSYLVPIDYSRAMLSPEIHKQDQDNDHLNGALAMYQHMLGDEYSKISRALQIEILQDPLRFWKRFTAIDMFSFASRLYDRLTRTRGVSIDVLKFLEETKGFYKSVLLDVGHPVVETSNRSFLMRFGEFAARKHKDLYVMELFVLRMRGEPSKLVKSAVRIADDMNEPLESVRVSELERRCSKYWETLSSVKSKVTIRFS